MTDQQDQTVAETDNVEPDTGTEHVPVPPLPQDATEQEAPDAAPETIDGGDTGTTDETAPEAA